MTGGRTLIVLANELITIANALISILFLAKLLWTVGIPIARKIEIQKLPIEDRERESKRGVSLALVIDIFLLLALVLISLIPGRGIFHLSAFWVLLFGVDAIFLSMVCCVIVGRIVRRI